MEWDGNLKRSSVPERLKQEQREMFYNYLQRTTSLSDCVTPEMEKLKQFMDEPIVETLTENKNKSNETNPVNHAVSSDGALLDEKLYDSTVRQRKQSLDHSS